MLQNILCSSSNAARVEEVILMSLPEFAFKISRQGTFKRVSSQTQKHRLITTSWDVGCHRVILNLSVAKSGSNTQGLVSAQIASPVYICREFHFILCCKISSFSCEWMCRAKHQIVCSCCDTLRPVYMFHNLTVWAAVFKKKNDSVWRTTTAEIMLLAQVL